MKYTTEHIEFLSQNVTGVSFKELTEKFNKRFKISLTLKQIIGACKNRNMRRGRDTRFTPNHKPYNTGTKGICKKNKGCFSKGHKPINHRIVGSERMSADGYIEIKITEPNMWRRKHVLMWENTHGKRPTNHVVIFADGNRNNINLDNLILIHRKNLLYLNQHKMIFDNADLTKTSVNIAKIRTTIYEKEKNGGIDI